MLPARNWFLKSLLLQARHQSQNITPQLASWLSHSHPFHALLKLRLFAGGGVGSVAPLNVPTCTLEEVAIGDELTLTAETEKPNRSKFIATRSRLQPCMRKLTCDATPYLHS